MKFLTPILLLGMLTLACGKKNEDRKAYTGYLLHRITKQPIANEQINLQISTTKLGPKSDEFPQGMPTIITNNYQAITDAEGKFNMVAEDSKLFFFSVTSKSWIVSSVVRSGNTMGINQPPMFRKFDTLFAERPGYVKYEINNIAPGYTNDSLFVATPYLLQWIIPSKVSGGIGGTIDLGPYNWLFAGPDVNRIIFDTIPAESMHDLEIFWAYKRTDTISKKTETIQVSPGTTTTYKIDY